MKLEATATLSKAADAPPVATLVHPVPARAVAEARPARGPFVPLLITALSVLGWLGVQGWVLLQERQALQAAHASQQQTVETAARLRASLDALAADTQRLADAGNANARLLVEELRKRGVTINTATPAKPQ
jgi:Tfp pilus assembly protein PilV